ncbi:sulfatase [Rhodopirellula sp. SWK7]|uniref:sulfatase family protein n=1 Tax=Rhodopirellula sp. SWK7 TaxID=595460 RepID=UPI0002BFA8DC|nr:sulfatase [Rhodopirellula sp. SWK7]EMI46068.1 heparan N-sulfatase [Rhodopirellula sp. SWK7]
MMIRYQPRIRPSFPTPPRTDSHPQNAATRAVWAFSLYLVFGSPFAPARTVDAATPPNALIILADDCTFNDLPVYGGVNAKTPNLDQFAAEGMVFNHAYLAEAMCQPCRAELYTGQYPMRNGCAWNHSSSLSETQSIPHHLGKIGYRVGLAGKVHVAPRKAFPFEKVEGFEPACTHNPTRPHDLSSVREFITRSGDEPFCLVVALVDPHVPWVMGDASKYPPAELELPPNIADTELTREAFSRYLAEITYMDGQVGELLSMLDSTGHTEDTLVMFSSEQGSQFPGNKWTNWDTGLHTALIARWPGVVPRSVRTDALVQYADVLPTLVDVASGTVDTDAFDGTSFLPVLKQQTDTHRQYVYGVHNNVPEGPPYPVRSISNGTYRYIRNLSPDNLYIEKHVMGTQHETNVARNYWRTWVWDSTTSPDTYNLVRRYQHRPAETLYHTASDPYEMQNVIGSDSTASIRQELSTELDRWLESQGDPGIDQDTIATHRAAKQGNHLYRAPAAKSDSN